MLAVYDFYVTYFNNRFAWNCPREKLVSHYRRHVTDEHLEVGVVSTYYLQRALPASRLKNLQLMDLNPDCLSKAADQLKHCQPKPIQHNVLHPFEGSAEPVTSIGINYVLHVVPGQFPQKGVAFSHLKHLLRPGGVLFGSTLLSIGVKRNLFGSLLMKAFNRMGIFNNSDDGLDGLRTALAQNFRHYRIEVQGAAALFSASDEALS